jgi:TolB-like protein/tRNA A-37 threonylcarbamoyl transferase component Bud32
LIDDDTLGSAATAVTHDTPPAPTSPPAMPSVLADRYEVVALLGAGGMGRVYRVHDRALDEVVALKVLRRELVDAPEMIERFRREVKLARRVTSPHVVRTFDLGQHAGEHFLTMEYVEGRSLAQLLEDGPLAIDEALRISRAIAAGMAAAHAAGVLHRDLQPDNVLVAKPDRIAITDFGIARASAGPTETVDRFVGTPAYMAPEQVDGAAPIGPHTDVYAMGAMMYEMLVGKRAFTGADAMQCAVARLTQPPPDPRVHRPMPDALATLVLRCMARDHAQRFADGDALGIALATMQAQPTATLPSGIVPIVPTKSSRAVAVLPLRSTPELADIADGLAEEIVDALTLTRALRVRPLSSVRGAYRPELDPRDIGRALGVDVIVDGSLRKIGDRVRVAARAIGVEDGFQLSADRIDVRDDELLSAGDAIARAVARALTVELDMPARGASNPASTALFLEGKSKVRASWMLGPMGPAIELFERALAIAPDDPGTLAALAIARARDAFFGASAELPRARALAERIVILTPADGEAWLALGLANLYGGEQAAAARALYRAVARAPGLATAQAALGAVLLEAGALDDGLAHLEGAVALDPTSLALWDLARGLVYAGRTTEAYERLHAYTGERAYAEVTIGRFHMWRGERYEARPLRLDFGRYRPDLRRYAELSFELYRLGSLPPADFEELMGTVEVDNRRLKASRAQFAVEFLVKVGDLDRAFAMFATGVASGLQDQLWCERCPILDGMRADVRWAPLAAIVAARANEVLAVATS